jgi:osmotically-inducible protein OsmY
MNSESSTSAPADQVEAIIERQLLGRVRISGFRVLVQEQGLILQGRAPTYYAKQIAQHVAMQSSGLAILANEIEVQ